MVLEVSDIHIVKTYKKNKHQGMELFYDRYKKYVYTIAYHYTNCKEDALDVTQEVFLSLFKSMDRIREEFSLLPLVKKVTINKCLNFARDKKPSISLNQTNDDGEEMSGMLPGPDNTENKALGKDTRKFLEKAIQSLPPEEKLAIVLRHIKGLKYEEIAKLMHLPLGTVKTHIYRGRKSIKDTLVAQGIWEV